MAIILTDAEKRKFKDILKTVMSSEELQAQFEQASTRRQTEAGDHQSAVLGLYASMIKEIQDERANVKAPKGAPSAPTVEELRKKFLSGPKTFVPKNRG